MAKIPYLSVINRVFYIDPQGMKRTHIVGLNRPTAQQEISKIHSKCPEAIILLQQDSNRAIQIVPGSGKASEAAKKTLVNEIDNWAHDLKNKTYYPSVADWAIAAGDTVCVIQPPAKSAITAKQIDDLNIQLTLNIDAEDYAPIKKKKLIPEQEPAVSPIPEQEPAVSPIPEQELVAALRLPPIPIPSKGLRPCRGRGTKKPLP